MVRLQSKSCMDMAKVVVDLIVGAAAVGKVYTKTEEVEVTVTVEIVDVATAMTEMRIMIRKRNNKQISRSTRSKRLNQMIIIKKMN